MSEWITDRRPTQEDTAAPDHCVYDMLGGIVPYGIIMHGEPWKPVPKCEAYGQPDAQADYTNFLRAEVEQLKKENDALRKVNRSMDTLLNRLQEAGVIS